MLNADNIKKLSLIIFQTERIEWLKKKKAKLRKLM